MTPNRYCYIRDLGLKLIHQLWLARGPTGNRLALMECHHVGDLRMVHHWIRLEIVMEYYYKDPGAIY